MYFKYFTLLLFNQFFKENHDIIILIERFCSSLEFLVTRHRISYSLIANKECLTHRSSKSSRVGAAGGDRRRCAGRGGRTDPVLRAQEMLLQTEVLRGRRTRVWNTMTLTCLVSLPRLEYHTLRTVFEYVQ